MRTSPHHILFTSHFGGLQGGGQRSILLLMKNLDRQRFEPHLLCSQEGDLLHAAQESNIKTHVINMPHLKSFNIFSIPSVVGQLKKLLSEEKIELIHTDSSRPTFYCGLAARKLGVPLLLHARVSTGEPKVYEKFLYDLSKKIIAVSNGARERFKDFKEADQKTKVIYNAIDSDQFNEVKANADIRREFNAEGKTLIGMIGEIIELKGQEDFIQAAKTVASKVNDVHFVIVGDGETEYINELKALIDSLGLKDHVEIVSFREDLPEVMASLDILVNASSLEGFSRVIIEAMASSKPVIATRVGGNPEAIEDGVNGLLVAPKDPQALAQAILSLCEDKDKCRRMGEASREKALAKFTVNEQVRQIESLYEELLNE